MSKRKIWITAIPILLFILLALFINNKAVARFEGWMYGEVAEKMSKLITSIMKFITHIGDDVTVIGICIILLLIPKLRKKVGIPVAITVVISTILSISLKIMFGRDRPDILRLITETSYSFPSGHALVNSALYTMLILLTYKYIKNMTCRITLSAFFVFTIVGIGYSRVYLGVHYAGDVAGGWLLGSAISMIIYFALNRSSTKEKLGKSS